jgi:hypothetical protein
MTQEALKLALEALKAAQELAGKHDAELEYGFQQAIAAIKEALAKEKTLQALHDENERLGLYKEAYAQPEQEPVAWMHNFIDGGISIGKRPADLNRHPDRWTSLYKEPKPCPTCEALARTVMLDQTSHDTTPPQRTWVGLTDDDWKEIEDMPDTFDQGVAWAQAKLKEKNT